ncbi:MAG: hypothetical protein WBF31_19835, partial [Anaerolineae bacterium]
GINRASHGPHLPLVQNQFVKIREIRGRKRQDSFATNDTNSHENKNQFVKIREIRGRKRLPCADASIDPN